jgi:hypothetical protein
MVQKWPRGHDEGGQGQEHAPVPALRKRRGISKKVERKKRRTHLWAHFPAHTPSQLSDRCHKLGTDDCPGAVRNVACDGDNGHRPS